MNEDASSLLPYPRSSESRESAHLGEWAGRDLTYEPNATIGQSTMNPDAANVVPAGVPSKPLTTP